MNDEIGRLATREYEVMLPDGNKAKLAFALCDLGRENALAQHARKRSAVAFGLLSFEAFAGAPVHPLLWVQTAAGMEMVVSDGDAPPGPELQPLIARHFALFFADINDVVPGLAALPLSAEEERPC